MNKIYMFKVDADLDGRLENFQKQLNESEEIVEQTTVQNPDGTSKLIITTKENKQKSKNLLFDQIRKGDMPNVFGNKKILHD